MPQGFSLRFAADPIQASAHERMLPMVPLLEGLRIVDASVFPRIPGFFIVSAVYMIGEKAADVIAASARAAAPLGPVKAW